MKHPEQDFEEFLYQSFARFRNLPPAHVELAWAGVLKRLRQQGKTTPEEDSPGGGGGRLAVRRSWAAFFVPAAAVLVAIIAILTTRRLGAAPAVVVEGSLYRTSGKAATVQAGQRINAGESVRSIDTRGAVLSLADGSSLEMRAGSELSLSRAQDGLRIHLGRGGVILTAAKQRPREYLQVQTKDVVVSVAGTVFLVSAEGVGSRVAVFEGAVRVQLGSTVRRLLPGQQLATSPKMETLPVQEEIAWSRKAEAHLSLLERSSVALQVAGNGAEPRMAFEEVSIRPRAPGGGGGKGGILPGGFTPACYGDPQIDPARFSISNTTVFQLIALAYGKGCERWEQQQSDSDALAGAPRWIREERFDIQAVIPEGTPAYTSAQLGRGQAREIQGMLQTMLADRFKLVLNRRTKEMPVYVLTLAKGGPKVKPAQDGGTRWLIRTLRMGADGQPRPSGVAGGPGGSMERLASALSNFLRRPVLDRTGITYEFGFTVEFALPEDDCLSCPTPATALQDTLGLKLDAARAPIEVLEIESVERPSEN